MNAEEARKLALGTDNIDISPLLAKIKKQAIGGKTYLYVGYLSKKEILSLRIKGYIVDALPNIATQKDGYEYKISW